MPNDSRVTKTHIFSADSPKVEPSEDELDRDGFSQEIARTLATWRSKETLVVSLSGEWGSGKTTICNFIKYHLRKIDPDSLIVDFNPWEWSGQEKVFEGFFWQIGSLFGKTDREKKTRRLLKRWRWLRVTLQATGAVSETLPKWIPTTIGALSAFGLVAGAALQSWWATISAGALSSIALVSYLVNIPERIAKYLQDDRQEETLDDLRDEIAEELDKLNRPIIVFIDDIDRLTDTEVALLFQLVKANVKLPNIVFFLMFQKSVVTGAICKLTSENGDKYLRKIIQVEWETPTASEAQIMPILLNGINRVLSECGPQIEWNKVRWTSTFYEGLWPYFDNLRDIHRFLGNLEFYFRLQTKSGILEVNPIDLIAIEVLRAFDSDAYIGLAHTIKWNEQFETAVSWRGEKALEEMRTKMSAISDKGDRTAEKKTALKVIFENLFPQIFEKQNEKDEFLKTLRICHSEHFYKYFRGSVDAKNVYAARWAEFLRAMNEPSAIDELINQSIKDDKLEQFLTQLWVGRNDVPIAAMYTVVKALFDAGDQFPKGSVGIGMFDPETTCVRFIRFRLLKEAEKVRTEIIKQALKDSTGFDLPLDFIAGEDNATRKRHPEIAMVVAEDDVKWLEEHGLSLIRKKAIAGTLLHQEGSGFALGRWEKWGPKGEAKEWVTKFAVTPNNALTLLKRLAGRTRHGDDPEEPSFSGKFVERYIALDNLKALVDQIPEGVLSEEDKQHKLLLSTAINQKRAGLPYELLNLRDCPQV